MVKISFEWIVWLLKKIIGQSKSAILITLILVGPITLIMVQIGFASDPILYLRCEDSLISESGVRPSSMRGVQYGPGVVGMACEFTGTGSASFASSGLWAGDQGAFMAWLKPRGDYNADSGRHDILSMGQEFAFFLSWMGPRPGDPGNVPGSIQFVHNPTATVGGWLSATALVSSIMRDNGWHHVAVTWGPNGKRVYLDGAHKAQAGYPAITRGLTPLYIGRSSHFGNEELFHVDSWLDEIRLYAVQLNDAEIAQIYQSEKPGDPAGCESTYDFETGVLHIPYLQVDGLSLWLDLELTSPGEPYLFELRDWGENR